MTAYVLTGPTTGGHTIVGGAKNAIVHAPSAAVAKRVACSYVDQLGMSESYFEDSSVVATAIAAASNWAGWTARVQVSHPTTGAKVVDVSVVAVDTLDNLGAALVTALNATAPIANAAYNSSTQELTVAGTGDVLGDHYLYVDLIPPGKTKAVNNSLSTKTHHGSGSAALKQVFAADAYAVPKVTATLRGA